MLKHRYLINFNHLT